MPSTNTMLTLPCHQPTPCWSYHAINQHHADRTMPSTTPCWPIMLSQVRALLSATAAVLTCISWQGPCWRADRYQFAGSVLTCRQVSVGRVRADHDTCWHVLPCCHAAMQERRAAEIKDWQEFSDQLRLASTHLITINMVIINNSNNNNTQNGLQATSGFELIFIIIVFWGPSSKGARGNHVSNP